MEKIIIVFLAGVLFSGSHAAAKPALDKDAAPPLAQSPQKAAKTINVEGKQMTFVPRNAEPDLANPALKKPVAYRRAPRITYQDSIPQDFELINSISTFSPPGEYAVWFFDIFNLGATRQAELLKISDLQSGKNVIPASAIKISQVQFWDFPRGPYTYFNIPDLIYPQTAQTLPAGGNKIFWLQTRLPENTSPGVYAGTAEVKCGDENIKLAMRLRVLPFKLMTPSNMEWSVYSRIHVPPQRSYSKEMKIRYLQDMKDYGINSLHYSGNIKEIQELRKAAGMDGTLMIYGIGPDRTAMKTVNFDEKSGKWYESKEVKAEFIRIMKAADAAVKQHGGPGYDKWLYMGADEPHIRGAEGLTQALWQNNFAREAGIRTAGTVYPPKAVQELASSLNVCCNMSIAETQEIFDELHKIAAGKDLQYWLLGGGAYNGQDGGLMPNRLLSGMMAFKLGVTGHLSYTYQSYGRPIDVNGKKCLSDPYDNLAYGKSYGMTYPAKNPTPEKVTVFSLSWEGIREGITDYKYLYTLKETIKSAEAKGAQKEAAEAQKTLDYILAAIPWLRNNNTPNGLTDRQTCSNDTVEKLRTMAANAIIELQEKVK